MPFVRPIMPGAERALPNHNRRSLTGFWDFSSVSSRTLEQERGDVRFEFRFPLIN